MGNYLGYVLNRRIVFIFLFFKLGFNLGIGFMLMLLFIVLNVLFR